MWLNPNILGLRHVRLVKASKKSGSCTEYESSAIFESGSAKNRGPVHSRETMITIFLFKVACSRLFPGVRLF